MGKILGKIFILSFKVAALVEVNAMLSDAKIKSLKIEDGKRHADRDGLVVEIRPSGKKAFLFRFQWDKKPQTITLSNYPSLSLAEARNKTIEYRNFINKGIDPRIGEANEQSQLCFQDVAKLWHQKNLHRWKAISRDRHYKSLVRDIYPLIGDKSMDEITKADLLQIVQPHELKGHHEIAHRLYARLQSIF